MANFITRHIPNSITCCNLFSGCIATSFAFTGDMERALLFIIIGAIFDFFDGMSARLLHVSSPMGKELDSLADVFTFGFAPAMMVAFSLSTANYPAALLPAQDYIPYLAFFLVVFSALRLAKFNIDKRQTSSFIGLPTPANALFWAALIVDFPPLWENSKAIVPAFLLLICLSCWLMIAEIPMFALKFKQWSWKGNEVKYGFLLFCIPVLLLFRISGIALIIACYVFLSIAVDFYQRRSAPTKD